MSTASGLVVLVMREQSVSMKKRVLKPAIGDFTGSYSELLHARRVEISISVCKREDVRMSVEKKRGKGKM